MPQDALEVRLEAIRWLAALEKLKSSNQLARPLYLVAGLTDETGHCWSWIDDFGKRCIKNWAALARIVPLNDAEQQRDFVDFGYFLRTFIRDDLGSKHYAEGATFDLLGHSMGGVDMFACLTNVEWELDRERPPGLGAATNFITLDTPFRGFINADVRMTFPDIKNNVNRTSQAKALFQESPLLKQLIRDRSKLSLRAASVTCYSAAISTAKEVEADSSDLCSDLPPHVTPWAEIPAYLAHSIPGVSHSGPSGITASEITIAQVFNQLLFR